MEIIEAKEILKIDFDKYTSININGVLVTGLEVFAEESQGYINIMGQRDEAVMLSTLLCIEDQAEIREEMGTIYIERIRR